MAGSFDARVLSMRMMIATVIVAGLSMAAVAMAQAPAPAGGLQAGDAAPAFSLPGSDGATHTLADFNGKKAVVIAWYPKAFTGG
jgi:peroxiredoxin Q/BCP